MRRIIGNISPIDSKVTIWGAGFSGLVLGYYLKKNGYQVTIIERSERVGGKLHSKLSPSGVMETGANALYLSPEGLELIRELNLEPLPAAPKLRRLIMENGKPRNALRFSVLTTALFNIFIKPPLITDGVTVADFFRPLVGEKGISSFITPVLSGLYASSAEQLHFKSVFPQTENRSQFESYYDFLKFHIGARKSSKKNELKGSVTFEGGMQRLIDKLAEELKSEIVLSQDRPFKLEGNVIICTDAKTASELLKEARPEMSKQLAKIQYRSLASATVFLKKEIRALRRAFGVLIPKGQNYHSIGILNNKAIFPANYKDIFSYTFISPVLLNDSQVFEDLKLLGCDCAKDEIEEMSITHWEKALPVYDLHRFLSIRKLHQLAREEKGLALFGNYVAGISLREMISAAKSFGHSPDQYPADWR